VFGSGLQGLIFKPQIPKLYSDYILLSESAKVSIQELHIARSYHRHKFMTQIFSAFMCPNLFQLAGWIPPSSAAAKYFCGSRKAGK
jgi:hypothetical protein